MAPQTVVSTIGGATHCDLETEVNRKWKWYCCWVLVFWNYSQKRVF